MGIPISLKYGQEPYIALLPPGTKFVAAPTPEQPPPDLATTLAAAMATPFGGATLESLARGARRITVITSDPTRREPRRQMLEAVVDRLPGDAELCLAVATGTHGPCNLEELALGNDLLRRFSRIVNHDGRDPSSLVEIGTTGRGTPVVVNRALAECDLAVATGAIVPHYFAGFGAGVKAMFPGLGGEKAIRINHRLKVQPKARAGITDGNPCREDLEEACGMVPARQFALNLVLDAEGHCRHAVAGDMGLSFRQGAALSRKLFEVSCPRVSRIVVSGPSPTVDSLYQASKLVAAVAPVLLAGGTIFLVADCKDGVGPLDTVNRGIYEIGLAPRLPEKHRIRLVSKLDAATVQRTYCEYCGDLEEALAESDEQIACFPNGSSLLIQAEHD